MSNNVFNATLSSFYEYIPKSAVSSDIPEVLGNIGANILDFQEKFQKGDFIREELNMIASELVTTAQFFGEQQGLSGSNLLDPKFLTAKVRENRIGSSFTIDFKNSAQDKYNRYYAGHVEYGHYSKNGKTFVEARPFMRPALYSVSKASKGELQDVFSDLLSSIFRENGAGYQGISNLSFGKKLGQRDPRGAKSSSVAKQLSQGPKRWNTKEKGVWGNFNEQQNFEKFMRNQWSLKRGLTGKSQIRQRRDVDLGRKGMSLGKARNKAQYSATTQTQRAKDNAKVKEFLKDKKSLENVVQKLNSYYNKQDKSIRWKTLKGRQSQDKERRLLYENNNRRDTAIKKANERFNKKWRKSSQVKNFSSQKSSSKKSDMVSNNPYQKILVFRNGEEPQEMEVPKEMIGIKYIENPEIGGYLERNI